MSLPNPVERELRTALEVVKASATKVEEAVEAYNECASNYTTCSGFLEEKWEAHTEIENRLGFAWLHALGRKTIGAMANVDEALKRYRLAREAYGLVITDTHMPMEEKLKTIRGYDYISAYDLVGEYLPVPETKTKMEPGSCPGCNECDEIEDEEQENED